MQLREALHRTAIKHFSSYIINLVLFTTHVEYRKHRKREHESAYSHVPVPRHRQIKTYLGDAEVCNTNCRHECSRQQCEHERHAAAIFHQISGSCPQHEHRQCLVRPTEITPNDIAPILISDVVP